jgi:tetratricopeptide (TPR) repeat protein
MNRETKKREHLFQSSFPQPLAFPYRAAQRSRSKQLRLAWLFASVDSAVRFLVSVLLADQRPGGLGPADAALRKTLERAGLGDWVGVLEELLGASKDGEAFLKPLKGRFLQSGKPTEALKLLRTLAEDCDLFVSGAAEASELHEPEALLELVQKLYAAVDFLADYPLGWFSGSGGVAAPGHFTGRFHRCMGANREPFSVPLSLEAQAPLDEPLLLSQGLDKALRLLPFVSLQGLEDARSLYVLAGLYQSGLYRMVSLSPQDIRALALEGRAVEGQVSLGRPSADAAARLGGRSRLLPQGAKLEGGLVNLGFVGRGSLGAVYRSTGEDGQEDGAVKVVYPDLAADRQFAEGVLAAWNESAKLPHPGLVPVREGGWSSEHQQFHLHQEFMPGGSLQETLETRPHLGVRETLEIFIPLLEALEFLHQRGRRHGALHPGNVLFDAQGRPRLSDPSSFSGQGPGRMPERLATPAFAPPELLLEGRCSKEGDLYSMGVIMYRALSGGLPDRSNPRSLSELILPFPRELDALVLRCLALQPSNRPGSAQALRDALSELLPVLGPEYGGSLEAEAERLRGFLADFTAGTRREQLERVSQALAASDSAGAAEALASLVTELSNPEERNRVRLELGSLYMKELGQPDKAMDIYREYLEWNPGHREAGDLLAEYYRQTGAFQSLSDLLRELAEHRNGEERLALLREAAQVAQETLADPARALACWQALHRIAPSLESAARVLELTKAAGQWEEASRFLGKMLATELESSRRRALTLELAEIREQRLSDPRGAVELLGACLEADPLDQEVADRLLALLKSTFAFKELALTLERLASTAQLPLARRLVALQDLGELYSAYFCDRLKAGETWTRLLILDPKHQKALENLERMALREGRHDDYAELLRRRAALLADPRERAALLFRAGEAMVRYLGDEEGALALLLEVNATAGDNEAAFSLLLELLASAGRKDELVELLLDRIPRTPEPLRRMELLGKLKLLMQEHLEDPLSALSVVQRMLVERPGDPALLEEACQLAESAEAGHALLYDFLRERVGALTGQEAVVWLGKAIELGQQAGRPVQELLALASLAVSKDPWNRGLAMTRLDLARRTNDPAVLLEALLALARSQGDTEDGRTAAREAAKVFTAGGCSPDLLPLMEKLATQVHQVPELRSAILCGLTGSEDPTRVLEALEVELKAETDPARKRELLERLAALHRSSGNLPAAISALEGALVPGEALASWNLMEELLGEVGDPEALFAFYRRAGLLAGDSTAKASFLKKAALVAAEHHHNPGEAAALYSSAFALAPGQRELGEALVGLLRQQERWEELASTLERLAAVGTQEERRASLLELARLRSAEEDSVDWALSIYRRALKLGGSQEVWLEMEGLCVKHGRWEQLLKALRERSLALEGQEKARVLGRMIEVALDQMGLGDLGERLALEALELDPSLGGMLPKIVGYFEARKDWHRLERILDEAFALAPEESLESLGLQLALVKASRLEHLVGAAEVLERVLEHNPENALAASSLACIYARQQSFEKAAPLFHMVTEPQPGGYCLSPLDYKLAGARAFETILDRSSALAWYQAALALDPAHLEARKGQARLLYLEKDWPALASLLPDLLKLPALTLEERRVFSSQFEELSRRLTTAAPGRADLEAMLAVAPQDRELLLRLMEARQKEGDSQGALAAMDQLLTSEADPDQRLELFVRKAELLAALPGDDWIIDELGALEAAAELRPGLKRIWPRIGEICLKLGEHEKAVEALSRVEELEEDPKAAAAAAFSVGLVLADYLGRLDEAQRHLQRALELDPDRAEVFARLEKLAVDRGDGEAQRDLYQKMIAIQEERKAPARLLRRLYSNLAMVAQDRLGDPALARVQLEKVLALGAGDSDTLSRLATIYEANGDYPRAVAAVLQVLATEPLSIPHLRELRRLSFQTKEFDRAWLVAGILVHLEAASEKEKQFYAKLQSASLRLKPFQFTAALWTEHVFPEVEQDELARIMKTLFERVVAVLPLPTHESLGGLVPMVEADAKALVTMTTVVSKLFGVPLPTLFRARTGVGLEKLPVWPPALAVGDGLLEGGKGKELRFEVARNLALLRPECGYAGLLDRDGLRNLLLNALKVLDGSLPEPPGDASSNAVLRKAMAGVLLGPVLDELKESVAASRKQGGDLNLSRWLELAEQSSCRAGLLLSNDFPVAAQMLDRRSVGVSRLTNQALVADLASYSLSSGYARLRQKLGLAVEPGA